MEKLRVSISGEQFAFDGLSNVEKTSNSIIITEPSFDETSSKIEYDIIDKEIYFQFDINNVNLDKTSLFNDHMRCNISIYYDANNKRKLVTSKPYSQLKNPLS